MKGLFRHPAVQGVLAWIFASYLKFCIATIRWRHVRPELAEAVWDAGGGVIVCFWHGKIGLSPACWPLGRAQEPRALISLSADGQFIASAMERLGFPAIRGSAAKNASAAKAKGGAQAFRDVLKWIKGGGGIAITPDGPRGPAQVMTLGVATLAGMSGAPVLLVGLACDPAINMKSWDRAMLPRPFGRGAIVWDGPHHAERTSDAGALGHLTDVWGARLNAVNAEAEALLKSDHAG
jgi:lysophospholipid acyltransferase (LPLAT)-like uncharacterized protein